MEGFLIFFTEGASSPKPKPKEEKVENVSAEPGTRKPGTHRFAIYSTLYIGFVLYMVCRKAFSFAMPAIMQQEGLQKDDLGMVSTSLFLAYTIFKFVGGLASDYLSPKTLYMFGLGLSGAVIIAFTWYSNVWIFCLLHFCLGICQGPGFPAFTNIVRHWYSPTEFGTWSSVTSTAKNVACSIGPIISTIVISYYGWRYLFFLIGSAAMAWVAVCSIVVVNKPEDVGIEMDTAANRGKHKGKGKGTGKKGSWKEFISSPLFWSLCLSIFVVFGLRIAVLDWAQMFIIQDLGMSHVRGSAFLSAIEVGGFFGALISGYLADKLVARSSPDRKRGSPRWTLSTVLVILTTILLHLMLATFSSASSDIYIMSIGAGLGATMYGCMALYDIMAQEAAPSDLAGTCHACTGLAGNIGSLFSGYPFTYVAKMYDWATAFYVLELALLPIIVVKIIGMSFEYSFVKSKQKVQ